MNPWRKRRRRRIYRLKRTMTWLQREMDKAIVDVLRKDNGAIFHQPKGWSLMREAFEKVTAGMDMQARADRAFAWFLAPHDPSEFYTLDTP